MAFRDITEHFYPNEKGEPTVKIDYKDKAHRYYAYPRIDFNLPVTDRKAWGKLIYPKGTTTLIGDTLEKKGLMKWPMGLALRELTGFYDFYNDQGEKLTGFSKPQGQLVGTLWDEDGFLKQLDEEALLPLVKSAAEASDRKKKKGADIGSIVHDAIEHYITDQPFDIGESYMWSIKDAEYENEGAKNQALKEFPNDVAQAELAFAEFVNWWEKTTPTLHGAEKLLYSLQYNVCGTYDADVSVPGKHHPIMTKKKLVRCTVDWKTSNASKSKEAAMPEGINYQYFTQSAIYELIRREMGLEPADDLLIVSARKDGGFSLVYASELGLSVQDCIDAAVATIKCYQFADKAKRGLVAHAEGAK